MNLVSLNPNPFLLLKVLAELLSFLDYFVSVISETNLILISFFRRFTEDVPYQNLLKLVTVKPESVYIITIHKFLRFRRF